MPSDVEADSRLRSEALNSGWIEAPRHSFGLTSSEVSHHDQNPSNLSRRRSRSRPADLTRSLSTVAVDLDYIFHSGAAFDKHGISFKVASTAVVAILRFQSTVCRPQEISLNVKIVPDDGFLENVRFPAELVESVTNIVQTRDCAQLKQLGGIQGLAAQLHTDLNQGLPTTYVSDAPLAKKARIFGDIEIRKSVFGENVYPRKKGKSLLGFLWEACHDTTLNILMLCAALSLGFGIKSDGIKEGWYDGVSIAAAIILVIAVTGVSNYKQSRQFLRLSEERDNIQVQAIRGGRRITVPVAGVVVGDLVYLSIGDQIPADGLFVDGRSLSVDESSFTGESDYYIPDPGEQAFLRSGSTIQDGYGLMLVTGVGISTEWGRMMAMLSSNTDKEETPLQQRLTKAAALIGKVGLSVAVLVLIILVIFYFTGHSSTSGDAKFKANRTSATDVLDAMVHIFSIAVTIVVVAVPEGLPLAVTLTLAYSMRRMMRDNALVRRLAACETMGSATAICSDKTGTLTMNKMTVVESWFAGKASASDVDDAEVMTRLPRNLGNLLFQAIAQNSTGSVDLSKKQGIHSQGGRLMHAEVSGSPTEKALLWWGLKAGMDFQSARSESSIVQVETFNSAKKRAGVAVKTSQKQLVVHWKGAAEIILSMCSKWVDMQQDETLTPCVSWRLMSTEKREELEALIESMASRSLRCVALAYTTLPQETMIGDGWSLPDSDLTFLAVVGIKDPCRPEVKAAVNAVKAAGVRVRMVTGDNLATAKAIALECGILEMGMADEAAIDGALLRSWTEEERKQNLLKVAVIGRALPSDKLMIVETLQSMGEVVAVTGDGTNDAPALHKADIGLSMGIQGTEVAKESSDIIILDDNFASVVKVVRWGRSVNFNIQKFLQFQLTVNVTALAVNFVAAVSSGDVPLTVVQLLWVNLIMDTLGALALATEPPTDELMHRPPVGRREPLITAVMWRNLAVQAVYQVAILLTLQFKGVHLLRLAGRKDADTINSTVIFNTFVLCQLFNEMNARQPYRLNIFHGVQNNRLFLGILAGTAILQVVMVEFLEKFASTVRLDWQHWLICISLAAVSWPIALIAKLFPCQERCISSPGARQEVPR